MHMMVGQERRWNASGWRAGVVRLQPLRGMTCIYEVTLASRFLYIFSPVRSIFCASVSKAHIGMVY
jgi:hypothetical protein